MGRLKTLSLRPLPLLAVLWLAGSGCYQYAPVPGSAPFPDRGEEVRIHLSAPRSLNLGTITVHDITRIEGEVFRTVQDTLAVFSRWLHTAYGGKRAAGGAVFYVPQGDIRLLEERRLLPLQTGLLATGGTVAMIALFNFLLKLGGGSNPDDSPPIDVAQVVLPLSTVVHIGTR